MNRNFYYYLFVLWFLFIFLNIIPFFAAFSSNFDRNISLFHMIFFRFSIQIRRNLEMDFGSSQFIIWRYIEYLINKYVSALISMKIRQQYSYKSHRFMSLCVHIIDWFISAFLHHFLVVTASLFPHSILYTPPPSRFSRCPENDKLFRGKNVMVLNLSGRYFMKKSSKIMEIGLISWCGLIL